MQTFIQAFVIVGFLGAQLNMELLAAGSPLEAKNGSVTLDAKPEPIALDPAHTAVIVVDMENDFAAKGGMFDRAGVDISGAEKAIRPTAMALATARQTGMKIIYLKMGYRDDLSDLGAPDSVNRTRHLRFGVGQKIRASDGRESRILIRDTWDTDIVSDLKPQPSDVVLYKTRFSGVTTSICVESTVRDAMFRDYLCVLLKDCMSEPISQDLTRTNHEASLLNAEVLLGWVSDSDISSRLFLLRPRKPIDKESSTSDL